MFIWVILKLWHTLLNILSQLLEIYVKVSFDWGQFIDHHFLNEFSLESIKFLSRVHLVNGINFLIKSVDLILACVQGRLKSYDFLLQAANGFQNSFLPFHKLWVRVVIGSSYHLSITNCPHNFPIKRRFNIKCESVIIRHTISLLFLSFALSVGSFAFWGFWLTV